jgi:hypothetical protein
MAVERIFDLSGGIQTATTWLLRQTNEVEDAQNARFDKELGAPVRRPGYELVKDIDGSTALGFHEAKFDTGAIIFVAGNDVGNTATIVKAFNPEDDTVTDVITDLPPNCELQFIDHINEVYVAGITRDTGARINIRNIRLVDGVLTVSTSRNLYGAPKAAFIGQEGGSLYAMNVELNGKIYPDRAYRSSPGMGAVTFVKGAQNNVYAPDTLIGLVPKMTSDTTPSGAVAAATYNGGTVWRGYGVFDRTTVRAVGQSYFSADGNPTGWIRYDFGSGVTKVAKYYSMIALNTNPSSNDAAATPKNWTFEGSNDGSSWSVLHTVTNQTGWIQGESRMFTTTNTTAYRYYRINVSANNGYANFFTMSELQFYGTINTGVRYHEMAVDSARYVKPGMIFDIYKAGKDQKLATITADGVDKSRDVITYLPLARSDVSFDNTNDRLTFPSTLDTTEFVTGTPIILSGSGAAPTGLTFGTVYYMIRESNTQIKLAATYEQALIGNQIDFTSNGSGITTVERGYVFDDNDEVWLAGRKTEQSILWNTDYRTEQTADFIYVKASATSDNSISGWINTNNRLQIFTPTSMWQWDGANFQPIFANIGCISHRSIKNNGPWVIWLDSTGQVRARDSTSGQDEIISRLVKNKYMENVPAENLPFASASMYDGVYKINLGQLEDESYLRMAYSFDANSWWRETHVRNLPYNLISRMSGKDRLYVLTDSLEIMLDEEGDDDHGASIPFLVEYGRRNLGSAFSKSATGFIVYGKNLAGCELFIAANNGKWESLGNLKGDLSIIPVGDRREVAGRDFNIKIAQNAKGAAPVVEGVELHFNQTEQTFGQ